MQHDLTDQHFKTYKEIKKWLDRWIVSKDKFFIAKFTYCQKSKKKVLAKNGNYILNKI